MKKVLILLFVFVFNALVCFAAYKPIPVEKSKQYKAEVESIINKEVPKAKQEVYDIFSQAQKAYKSKSIYTLNDLDLILDSPEYGIHIKIIDVTNKYVNIKNDVPSTDSAGALYDFLYPYFKDNSVDLTQLTELINLAGKTQKEIDQMTQTLSKILYTYED